MRACMIAPIFIASINQSERQRLGRSLDTIRRASVQYQERLVNDVPAAVMLSSMATPQNYLTLNQRYYEQQYAAGYGHEYPESHVIRIYHRILASELNLTGAGAPRLLDFGCGTGANAAFFATKGFDVHGVDSSARAIEACRRRLPDTADQFQAIKPDPTAEDWPFDASFDIVFSNQVLYFLGDHDLRERLELLLAHLAPDGIFIATMIGTTHYLYRHSTLHEDGLRRVQTKAEGDQPLFIRFTESKDHLRRQFAGLEAIHIGHYDVNLRDDSGFHYVFIGRPTHSAITSTQRNTAG